MYNLYNAVSAEGRQRLQSQVKLRALRLFKGRLIETWDEHKGANFSNTEEGVLPNPKPFITSYFKPSSERVLATGEVV